MSSGSALSAYTDPGQKDGAQLRRRRPQQGSSMPEYRLYCLDGDGHFAQVHEITANSDADALEQALEMKLSVKCELWQLGRLVASLPAAVTAD